MANNYLTPGVYVQEISTLPESVVEVQSAVPAFIGYTAQTRYDGRHLAGIPEPVSSFRDFEARFGGAAPLDLEAVSIRTGGANRFESVESVCFKSRFFLYEAVYTYFQNGGGPCFVVSTGSYASAASARDKELFLTALEALEAVDDVTLLVMPEAVLLGDSLLSVQQAALAQCARRLNRFAILDIAETAKSASDQKDKSILLSWPHSPDTDSWKRNCQLFRDRIGISNLSYGAAYTPYIIADVKVDIQYEQVSTRLVKSGGGKETLSFAELDPSAKYSISSLETALSDRDKLNKVIELFSQTLTSDRKKTAATEQARALEASVDETVSTICSEKFLPTVQSWGDLAPQILSYLTGAPEAQAKAADAADYKLSPNIIQYVYDQLKGFLMAHMNDFNLPDANKKALQDAVGLEQLLPAFQAAFRLLGGEARASAVALLDRLLRNDLHAKINMNIQRLSEGLACNSAVYRAIASAVQTARQVQPPSAAMAGIYAAVDRQRGVWKAPANVSLSGVRGLTQAITSEMQESLNRDSVAGKSINALRAFPGQGNLVWGARTLDGNSLEWRYIPVRRFFIMVEESIRRATARTVFEPNDATLWSKLKAMIDNYLLQKWKEGALQGASPAEAFFVTVGLGSTMTAQDILEGRLIIDIGMAMVRPAEFIILRFMHKMRQS